MKSELTLPNENSRAKEFPEAPHAVKATTTAVGCIPRVDSSTFWLKTPHASVLGSGGMKLGWHWTLPTVLGSIHSTRKSLYELLGKNYHQPSCLAVDTTYYSTRIPGKIFLLV